MELLATLRGLEQRLDIALLTCRSAHVGPAGALERHTLRASLWQRTEQGWKMRFHQGTPTNAFEKRED